MKPARRPCGQDGAPDGRGVREWFSMLPVHWASQARILRIKGFRREDLAGEETPVVRLRFARDPSGDAPTVGEFRG